jgi:hypothetical protein
MDRQDEFIIEEYKTAVKLTYHIDELRNKLTTFFLTMTGIGAAGLAIFFKGEARTDIFNSIMNISLLVVVIVGFLIVMVLARLRRVQIEHFGIIDNIREYFFNRDYHLWNVIQLSQKTKPSPNRGSGTYLWLLVIIMVNSSVFALSIYIFSARANNCIGVNYKYLVSFASFCLLVYVQDWIYFKLAFPIKKKEYSENSPPF